MRKIWHICKETGELVEGPAGSRAPNPGVIGDAVEPFVSQVDGQTYDSKSTYRASLRHWSAVRNNDYRELGNDYSHLMREPEIAAPSDRQIESALARNMERMGWR
jgi:hypothetical protein